MSKQTDCTDAEFAKAAAEANEAIEAYNVLAERAYMETIGRLGSEVAKPLASRCYMVEPFRRATKLPSATKMSYEDDVTRPRRHPASRSR